MKFAILPHTWEDTQAELEAAGHEFVTDLEQADFMVYHGTPAQFPEIPDSLGFIQLAFAGLDAMREAGKLNPKVRWANAAGLYADSVAEGTLGLLLGAIHMHKLVTRRASWQVAKQIHKESQFLYDDKTVAIFGAGGIGIRLIEMLKPFGPRIIAVNNSGRQVPGADHTVPVANSQDVWSQADYVIILMPLTEDTYQFVDSEKLQAMKPGSFLINAGRGPVVDTDALVHALTDGPLAGAGLDVTDPEPLPDGHPLWDLDNCLITPHTTNTLPIIKKLLGGQAVENARLFEVGKTMATEVDVSRGY